MTFIWPEALWLLLIVPPVIAAYLWLLRRRKRGALRYANLTIVKLAVGASSMWRRHLPPALLLVTVILLTVAVARPAAVLTLPTNGATVVLAIDVSASMGAVDIYPTRIAASQKAAKQFVAELPGNVQIGIVAFASTAALVQPPTTDRASLDGAIDGLQLGRGTAIGDALLVSLQTIFADQKLDISVAPEPAGSATPQDGLTSRDARPAHIPVKPGSYDSAIVVLLTDGAATAGSDPLAAAQTAADYGVRVYTVGFGSANGSVIDLEGSSLRAKPDLDTLQKIADRTAAQYFDAHSTDDLARVYRSLSAKQGSKGELTEISFIFAAVAALLIIVAAALSLLWFGRVA